MGKLIKAPTFAASTFLSLIIPVAASGATVNGRDRCQIQPWRSVQSHRAGSPSNAKTSKSKRSALLAMITVLLLPLAALLLSASEARAQGALVWGWHANGNVYYSYDVGQYDLARAKRKALAICLDDSRRGGWSSNVCLQHRVLLIGNHFWLALAWGEPWYGPRSPFGWYISMSKRRAQSMALRNCRRSGLRIYHVKVVPKSTDSRRYFVCKIDKTVYDNPRYTTYPPGGGGGWRSPGIVIPMPDSPPSPALRRPGPAGAQ